MKAKCGSAVLLSCGFVDKWIDDTLIDEFMDGAKRHTAAVADGGMMGALCFD